MNEFFLHIYYIVLHTITVHRLLFAPMKFQAKMSNEVQEWAQRFSSAVLQ